MTDLKNSVLRGLVLSGTLMIAPGAAGMSIDDPSSFPPMAPGPDEQVIHDVGALDNACLRKVHEFARIRGWTLGRPLTTNTTSWGVVWRFDFKSDDIPKSAHVNRIVCWNGDDNFLVEFGVEIPAIAE